MKYNCPDCNYETHDRTCWYAHKKSKKHQKIEEDKLKLIDKEKNHEVIQLREKFEINENEKINNNIIYKNYEIELLRQKLEASENEKKIMKEMLENTKSQMNVILEKSESQISEIKKQVEILQTENHYHKQLINSAGGMIKKSMNTLNYLLLNYKDAPHIQGLPNYSIISKSVNDLIKTIVYYYEKNKLDKHIGDFIIGQYKKEEPELQSLWSSDTERLNYFICELIKGQNDTKNNETRTQWVLDKKGLKMSKYVIKPLLDYIYDINSNYINQQNERIEEIINNDNNDIDTISIIKEMQILASINVDIKNNKLANDINKYIAPHFYFDKNLAIENK